MFVRTFVLGFALLVVLINSVEAKTVSPLPKLEGERYELTKKYCRNMDRMPLDEQARLMERYQKLSKKIFEETLWDCYDPQWRINGKSFYLNPKNRQVAPQTSKPQLAVVPMSADKLKLLKQLLAESRR